MRTRCLHLLYQRYYRVLRGQFRAANADGRALALLPGVPRRLAPFLRIGGRPLPTRHEPRHTFACFRQIQRAFEQIFRDIIGSSTAGRAAARLGLAIDLHARHAALPAHAVSRAWANSPR